MVKSIIIIEQFQLVQWNHSQWELVVCYLLEGKHLVLCQSLEQVETKLVLVLLTLHLIRLTLTLCKGATLGLGGCSLHTHERVGALDPSLHVRAPHATTID